MDFYLSNHDLEFINIVLNEYIEVLNPSINECGYKSFLGDELLYSRYLSGKIESYLKGV